MKVKTSELIGPALDWAVAKCVGLDPQCGKNIDGSVWQDDFPRYSTDWAQGGPIIDREEMEFIQMRNPDYVKARCLYGPYADGPTLLIAAMRCYVASELGDEIEIPEELK